MSRASIALVLLVACSDNPLVPGSPDMAAAQSCPSGTRLFNGECRVECGTTACAAGSLCMSVDAENPPVCLPYTSCAYLDSDTQCVGVPYSYGRGSMATAGSFPADADPNNVTLYDDTYFEAADPSTYYQDTGCRGNAHWVTVAASGDVACKERQKVQRCRLSLSRNQCLLVDGTTSEMPAP